MAETIYDCETCGQSTVCVLSFCCYKVLCLKCSLSSKHQCQITLNLFQCKVQEGWCCRCLTRICKRQCQGCKGKKFCNQCFDNTHNQGKFQFHHSIYLDTQRSNQICTAHKSKKSFKNSEGSTICIICLNSSKKGSDAHLRKTTPKLSEIQERIKLEYNNLMMQENSINDHWRNIEKKMSNQFANLHLMISSIKQEFLSQIQIKKSKNLQQIKDKLQSAKNILNQIKNIHNLAKKNDENLNIFMNEKIKQLANQSFNKIYNPQEHFSNTPFDLVKSSLDQLDLNKILLKERPKKQGLKLKKVTSATYLHVQETKSPKSKRSVNELLECSQKNIDKKIRKISQNQEDYKNDSTAKKKTLINNSNQLVFRNLLSPSFHKKEQQKSVKRVSGSQCS